MNWRKFRRIAWLIWCAFWALSWLAVALQSFIEWQQYGDPGAEFDMVFNLVGFGASIALMWVPIGKARKEVTGNANG